MPYSKQSAPAREWNVGLIVALASCIVFWTLLGVAIWQVV